jgi:hypothetical protein
MLLPRKHLIRRRLEWCLGAGLIGAALFESALVFGAVSSDPPPGSTAVTRTELRTRAARASRGLSTGVGSATSDQDGCKWRSGFTIADLDDFPVASVVFDDGGGPALYVGGHFIAADGRPVNHIAKWDGDHWTALAGPGGVGLDGTVMTLAVFDDGAGPALYVGGGFTTAGGVPASGLARWDGTAWSAVADTSGGGLDGGRVDALVVYDDGEGAALFVGGDGLLIGNASSVSLARWDGSTWSILGDAFSGLWWVSALAVFDDGTGTALYVGGTFPVVDGIEANNILRWDGESWSTLSGPSGTGLDDPYGHVYVMTVYDDGGGAALYVGGTFESAGGVSAPQIARWDGTGWSALTSSFDTSWHGEVWTLAVVDDGGGPALYAGGRGAGIGMNLVGGVARWDGTAWSALEGPAGVGVSGATGSVATLAVYDDGTGASLFVGGNFTTAGGLIANRIAIWNDGAWRSVNSHHGGSPNGTVNAMEVFDDGAGPALFVAGDFADAGVPESKRIAKWSGTSWASVPGAEGLNGPIHALTTFDDGNGPALYAAGDFSTVAGITVNSIAKWDGTSWSPLAVPGGIGLDLSAYALEVFDDGTGPALFVGGRFHSAGGVTVEGIARWNGSAWSALDGPSGVGVGGEDYPTVWSLEVYRDWFGPALYVGGAFDTAGGVPVENLAIWNGSEWAAVGGGGINGDYPVVVRTMLAYDDGAGSALFIGGDFDTAWGMTVNGVVKWLIGGPSSGWSQLAGPSAIGIASDSPAGGPSMRSLLGFDDGTGSLLIAGGFFTSAGGVPVQHLATWNGGTLEALGGIEGNGMGVRLPTVEALASFDSGSGPVLYVGGDFNTAGDIPSSRIAAWCCDAVTPSHVATLASSSHGVGEWSADPVVRVEWSGACDAGCSGLLGYSVSFDTSAGTVPDAIVDVQQTADPHGFVSPALGDGASYWFHVRACDGNRNCSVSSHLGPFLIDTTAPGSVFQLESPSHPVSAPTSNAAIELTWAAATDALSGVAGYAVGLSPESSWVCDHVVDADVPSVTLAPVDDGSWFAHVCAVDTVGNWGEVASAGPLIVDTTPPTVLGISTVADSGDGELRDLEGTAASITQLIVMLDEEAHNPQGDSQPEDVTNPANYLVVTAGVDGVIQSSSCLAGTEGDDLQWDIGDVQYAVADGTATARLADEVPLGRGRYRLLVCGTTSVADIAGNLLDGNADGVGGDDLRLDFSVLVDNLLPRPNFDSGLGGWSVIGAGSVVWSDVDAGNAATSGSAEIAGVVSGSSTVAMGSPAIGFEPHGGLMVGCRVRVAGGSGHSPEAHLTVVFLDQEGKVLSEPLAAAQVVAAGGVWLDLRGWVPVPARAVAAKLVVGFESEGSVNVVAYVDDVVMYDALFRDGFETGRTDAWTATTP